MLSQEVIVWIIMGASRFKKNGPEWGTQGKKWAGMLEIPGTISGPSALDVRNRLGPDYYFETTNPESNHNVIHRRYVVDEQILYKCSMPW